MDTMASTHPQNGFDKAPGNTGLPEEFPPLGTGIKVLLVWPRFPASFWSFSGMLELLPQAVLHPPLGLITVAALCPKNWTLRLIDRNLEEMGESDIHWADLVMVSGMRVQHEDMRDVLVRARALGKRTMVGGPYASSEPEAVSPLADHVVAGEPDEVFGTIAVELERGSARKLYVVEEKPDVSKTPVPRYDLLRLDKYLSMTVQFSRGCPFQCEFCDIITIYGRRPRTKTNEQMLVELGALLKLGWRGRVFVVDDNFIGNHKRALDLSLKIEEWQKEHTYPFALFTEASMNLAQHPALMEAMVRANFSSVFLGIESPSRQSLTETKKFQNLRDDPLECVRLIRRSGLWVTAGFIVGFDSDTADIFERQIEFIERAAIPWAMSGFLVALPTTPLHARMAREGRLIESKRMSTHFKSPNFRTVIPLPTLLNGGRSILQSIYEPSAYYDRCLRSLEDWGASEHQKPVQPRRGVMVRALVRSIIHQGILSHYRVAYWKFLFRLLRRWRRDPLKASLGFTLLISGHHFIKYARTVTAEMEHEIRNLTDEEAAPGLNLTLSAPKNEPALAAAR
jgi:radical SAM superfamily enzyme YgiQ (UPF0313 family)